MASSDAFSPALGGLPILICGETIVSESAASWLDGRDISSILMGEVWPYKNWFSETVTGVQDKKYSGNEQNNANI